MSEVKSDIQIAREAKMQPINDILAKINVPDESSAFSPMGRHIAKINLEYLDTLKDKPNGKLILVTAITPTPAGEGKTTTSVGLNDGLNKIGKKSIVCLREPSLGPSFGMKGGAAGGGYAQVVPMEQINLHFTGDFHAITSAHNLLSALIDNHIYWGNKLDIDVRRIAWKRVMDMNDRSLRSININLGGVANGFPREDGFDITVASEIMAIFCLSNDLEDLEKRIGNITIAYTRDKKPVYAKDLKAQGPMTVLLKDAIRPNVTQTLENNPAIIHGGPFANIAHGCNSVIATKTGLKLADYVVTEAGFGADLGAEKFLDIKCRKSDLKPSCVVIVATIRALKMHGGVAKDDLNPENVLSHADEIKPYETDGLSAYTQTPLAVVMPENTEEVSNILKFCHKENIKVVPRGAGTGLSGGALPLNDAILLSLGKFNKIIEIDFENKCVVTQPGVTNLGITHAVQHKNFYYAPDPSSQIACSIGGNVAENSGGVHSLKYGTTTNNILGVEIVMMDGTICRIGGKTLDQEGYDLMGLICGSEGLLGVITEVTVKILKNPQIVKAALIGFPTIEEGGNATSEIIASGIVPAGMEIMDKILIEATDNFSKAGYPRDAELLLIVELDGTESEVDELLKQVSSICKKNNCSSLKLSKNEKERLSFWAGRKAAFPACGAMAPDYYCMDGSIPRGKLTEALLEIKRLSEKYELPVANCFHAGDGNLHPLIMFDGSDKEQLRKTEEFGAEILKACVRLGGVITGEHGVGIEKRELMCEMFNNDDIQQQLDIKSSLDEKNLLNPGKVYPILRKCAEEGRVHVHRNEEKFPDLPRF